MSWQPWNHYTGLTLKRLVCVADIIRTARDGAADDHHPETGEGPWSLGVRCYERTCNALSWATKTHGWLTIVTGSEGGPVHFVMAIGGHAVRFCHGTPEDIPRRYRERSFPEFEQQLALQLDGAPPGNRALRIVIENDASGHPETMCLVEISNDTGNAINACFIPLSIPSTVAPFAPSIAQPASIGPVSAEPLGDQQADAEGAKTGSGDD